MITEDNDQICVDVHPELPSIGREVTRKNPNVSVDVATGGKIRRICYNKPPFTREEVISKIPEIMQKDAQGCELCKRVAEKEHTDRKGFINRVLDWIEKTRPGWLFPKW